MAISAFGVVTATNTRELTGSIRHASDGCSGVVLGGTEIPLLVRDEDMPFGVRRFDTLRVDVERAVEVALAG